jgi:hypothetical protein
MAGKPPTLGKVGSGRQKGTPNKITRLLKDMIVTALEEEGGVDYLRRQPNENPTAFMTLVGKVIPLQITGDPDNPVTITRIELVAPQMDQLPAPEIELVGYSVDRTN